MKVPKERHFVITIFIQAAWCIKIRGRTVQSCGASDSSIGGSTQPPLLSYSLTGRLFRMHCLSLTAVCSLTPFSMLLTQRYLEVPRMYTAHLSIREHGADGACTRLASKGAEVMDIQVYDSGGVQGFIGCCNVTTSQTRSRWFFDVSKAHYTQLLCVSTVWYNIFRVFIAMIQFKAKERDDLWRWWSGPAIWKKCELVVFGDVSGAEQDFKWNGVKYCVQWIPRVH